VKAKFFIPLALFVVLAALLGWGLKLNPREVPSPFIGKPTPAFNLPQMLADQPSFDPAQMKGQVWMLNVWASWCVPCREEHPLLMQVARQQTLPVVGLNYKDSPRDAGNMLRASGNPYQAIPVDSEGKVGIDYGVYGVPETFIIDREGVIRYKQIGPITPEAWSETLLPLINKLKG
jgi:cytochrome c biogenesis protein CcmG/thiol:disulfide interchange protein DsbE